MTCRRMARLFTVAILSLLVLPACVQNGAMQVPEIDDNSASVRGEHFITGIEALTSPGRLRPRLHWRLWSEPAVRVPSCAMPRLAAALVSWLKLKQCRYSFIRVPYPGALRPLNHHRKWIRQPEEAPDTRRHHRAFFLHDRKRLWTLCPYLVAVRVENLCDSFHVNHCMLCFQWAIIIYRPQICCSANPMLIQIFQERFTS
jgi:hypothetical protein